MIHRIPQKKSWRTDTLNANSKTKSLRPNYKISKFVFVFKAF